jgi:hypothetical protein
MKSVAEKPLANMVQSMRQIRDEISNEIKDMSFEEERNFLDNLLKTGKDRDILSGTDAKETPSTK